MSRRFNRLPVFVILAFGLVVPGLASAQSIFDDLQALSDEAAAQERATRPVPEADAAWAEGVESLNQGIEDLKYDLERDGGEIKSYHLTMDCIPIYNALASFNHAKAVLALARGESLDYDNRYSGSDSQLTQMQDWIDQTYSFFKDIGCQG